MMDGRLLEHPHAQFGGSLGGVVGFPYPLGHHHVYELAGHQLQSAAAAAAAAASVPFSIDGLLSGSCAAAAASVVNPTPLLPAACGVGGDSQPFKLSGRRSGRGGGGGGACRGPCRAEPWVAGGRSSGAAWVAARGAAQGARPPSRRIRSGPDPGLSGAASCACPQTRGTRTRRARAASGGAPAPTSRAGSWRSWRRRSTRATIPTCSCARRWRCAWIWLSPESRYETATPAIKCLSA
uniref:Uncharacterized protein n=1 Tax=Sus scrofa TaxID=9823 RepID=A0A8D2BC11_PIG